jgi:outer membrane lipoprotein-sorting protein
MSTKLIRFIRTAPARRLLALSVIVVAIGASIVAIASAGDSGPVPAPATRAEAIHNALSGPAVAGLSADVKFTNHLIDSSSIQGADPLLSGGTGRVWVGADGRFRLELQGDNGDPQITSDGTHVTIYDAAANTAYRATLPQEKKGANEPAATQDKPPTLADIQTELDKIMKSVNLSEAMPTNVGGRPAYTVRVTPQHDAGLLGAAEVAWDSAHGVPLRVAVYAADNPSPVLELSLTGISYGAVPDSTFDVAPPAGAKVVDFNPAGDKTTDPSGSAGDHKPVTGVDAVGKAVPFALKAPDTLAGLPRHEVRLLDWHGTPAALVLYGRNLGGIAVIEQKSDTASGANAAAPKGNSERPGLSLPTVSINGVTGHELGTALGTIVQFTRGGIDYTIIGSVPPAAAEAAARDSGLN